MPEMAQVTIDGIPQVVILNETTFKTGSRGFRGNAKLNTGTKKYQLMIIATEIGSKPSS